MIEITHVKIVRLCEDHNFLPFKCSDSDLDEFLLNDSKNYLRQLLSVTYLIEYEGVTIAFFSVLNDKISIQDFESNRKFKRIFQDLMPAGKRYKSYPAVKIGRFAVHAAYQNQRFGSTLLDYIKGLFIVNNKTGCQYITVDAYSQSLKFYENNGFEYFSDIDKGKDTRQMYFSLLDLIN